MSEIPLEGLGSEATYNEAAIECSALPEFSPERRASPPISFPPPPSGPSLSRRLSAAFCCPCGCDTSAQSTPLHQVQPVILRPTNDVYLELKPNRRLRVIHIPPGGNSDSISQQNNGKKVFFGIYLNNMFNLITMVVLKISITKNVDGSIVINFNHRRVCHKQGPVFNDVI